MDQVDVQTLPTQQNFLSSAEPEAGGHALWPYRLHRVARVHRGQCLVHSKGSVEVNGCQVPTGSFFETGSHHVVLSVLESTL